MIENEQMYQIFILGASNSEMPFLLMGNEKNMCCVDNSTQDEILNKKMTGKSFGWCTRNVHVLMTMTLKTHLVYG